MNGLLRHSTLLGSQLREDGAVVAPGFLQNPAVRNWLGGIVPAWTMLDQKSFEALRLPPLPPVGAIRFPPSPSLFKPGIVGDSTQLPGSLPRASAAFGFQFPMPTKEWFQLAAGGERKRGSQSVAYEFRTE